MKTLIILSVVISFSLLADDPVLAEALAATGATYAARGDTDKAKDALYRALANDQNCATAMFELAKIADKEGDKTTASDLFTKCYGRLKDTAKQAHCESRLKALNPYAIQLNVILSEYKSGLKFVEKTYPTAMVLFEAKERLSRFDGEIKTERNDIAVQFDPVGQWQRDDSFSLLTFKKDNTVFFEPKGSAASTGKWTLSGNLITISFTWGTSHCAVISDSKIVKDSVAKYTRKQ
jgi:tetratricopeptide (TPR) repeat protein